LGIMPQKQILKPYIQLQNMHQETPLCM
jgi:hypothetical protein